MNSETSYIHILLESLYKKIKVLDEILKFNQHQKEVLEDPELTLQQIEPDLQKKQELIDELNRLDAGFDQVYQRVKEELVGNSVKYADEIVEMKRLIVEITNKSVRIQTEEARNKKSLEQKFKSLKTDVKQSKARSKVANNYYNSMNQLNNIEPQFMDKKK